LIVHLVENIVKVFVVFLARGEPAVCIKELFCHGESFLAVLQTFVPHAEECLTSDQVAILSFGRQQSGIRQNVESKSCFNSTSAVENGEKRVPSPLVWFRFLNPTYWLFSLPQTICHK